MTGQEQEAIIAETQAFADAWNRGDAREAAAFYADDGARVGAFGDAQRGRAEIEAAYERLLRTTMPGSRVSQERGTVRVLAPDLAVWQGRIEIVPPDGAPALRGHVVQVMKKVGGRWLILESHPKLFPAPQSSGAPASPAQALRMQVQVVGEGAPLALIGGGLTGWKSWEPHAERLAVARTAARLQLVSVQYGLEDRPLPHDYSVAMESAALAAALDGLGWRDPVDLVAWSYGALITLDFALNHPDRVRTLVLIEPPAVWVLPDRGQDDPDAQALQDLARTMTHDTSEADLERFVCTVGLCPPGIVPQELAQWPAWMEHRRSLRTGTSALDHSDDVARLRAFDGPVLLVTGTGTAPFLRRIHELLAVHLPRARAVEMPAGHAPHLVSMDRFLAELERFHGSAWSALESSAEEQVAR